MSRVTINHENIKRMFDEMQGSFDRNGPLRVNVVADSPDGLSTALAIPTTVNNFNGDGPVIYGDRAQVAYGNQSVTQTQLSELLPEVKAVADAVTKVLELLPHTGIAADEQEEAETAGRELLAEIARPEHDPKKVKRALMAMKGYFAPIALGMAAGASTGAQGGVEHAAQTAIEALLNAQL